MWPFAQTPKRGQVPTWDGLRYVPTTPAAPSASVPPGVFTTQYVCASNGGVFGTGALQDITGTAIFGTKIVPAALLTVGRTLRCRTRFNMGTTGAIDSVAWSCGQIASGLSPGTIPLATATGTYHGEIDWTGIINTVGAGGNWLVSGTVSIFDVTTLTNTTKRFSTLATIDTTVDTVLAIGANCSLGTTSCVTYSTVCDYL